MLACLHGFLAHKYAKVLAEADWMGVCQRSRDLGDSYQPQAPATLEENQQQACCTRILPCGCPRSALHALLAPPWLTQPPLHARQDSCVTKNRHSSPPALCLPLCCPHSYLPLSPPPLPSASLATEATHARSSSASMILSIVQRPPPCPKNNCLVKKPISPPLKNNSLSKIYVSCSLVSAE